MKSTYALALLALVLVACAGPADGTAPDADAAPAPQEDAVIDSFDQAFEEPAQDDSLTELETLDEDLQFP